MKADKGELIICKCPQAVGWFRADVADRASVSPQDFEIALDGAPDDNGPLGLPDVQGGSGPPHRRPLAGADDHGRLSRNAPNRAIGQPTCGLKPPAT
jgi:hypothetical protein